MVDNCYLPSEVGEIGLFARYGFEQMWLWSVFLFLDVHTALLNFVTQRYTKLELNLETVSCKVIRL